MTEEIKTDTTDATPQAEPVVAPAPVAEPASDDASKWRERLAEEGRARKAAEAELEQLRLAKTEQEKAELEKREEYKTLYEQEKAARVKAETARKRTELNQRLLEEGVQDPIRRKGLMADWTDETDVDSFLVTVKEQYPAAFEPDRNPARSAGAVGAVSTQPTKNGASLLEDFRSPDNNKVAAAFSKILEMHKAGTLDPSIAAEVGL
jgi:hypothetical protein